MPLRRPFRALSGPLVLAALLAACSDATEPAAPVARIDFSAVPDTIGIGDSLQVPAFALDASNGAFAGTTLAWISRSPAVVAVTTSGAARALATGDAWLVATVGGPARGSDSVRVRVEPDSRSLRLVVARDSVAPGDTLTARASVVSTLGPAFAAGSVRWASSDTLVARVDSLTGRVRVMSDGDATITATADARTTRVTLRSWLQPLATGGVRLVKIAVGRMFGCGLDAAGVAYCWGMNNHAQLGRGTRGTGSAVLPFAPVSTSSRYTMLAAGRGGACGVTTAGALECWGATLIGLVPDLDARTTPKVVTLPPSAGAIRAISVGVRWNVCVIDDAGAHFCWGDNTYENLGEGSVTVTAPRAISGLTVAVRAIVTAETHGCAIATSGPLYCWGDGQGWDSQSDPRARVVAGVPAFTQLVANWQGTCGLDAAGAAWCAGIDMSSGSYATKPFTRIQAPAAFTRLVGGFDNVCGLTATGLLACWNAWYSVTPAGTELFGYGSAVPFSRRHQFVDASASAHAVCGITTSGATVCRDNPGVTIQ